MPRVLVLMVLSLLIGAVHAADPDAFRHPALPGDWTATGTPAAGDALSTEKGSLAVTRSEPIAVSSTIVIQFHSSERPGTLQVDLRQPGEKQTALTTRFILNPATLTGAASATVQASSDGAKMATQAISSRTWSRRSQPTGSLRYGWRFPKARNTWEDRDRVEIGSSYAALTTYDEKLFTYRIEWTATTRQIWLDDRLVAEDRRAATPGAQLQLTLTPGASLASVAITPTAPTDGPLALDLAHWFHHGGPATSAPLALSLPGGESLSLPVLTDRSVDLSQSLHRYRLTRGSGPDAPYVNGQRSWPDAFSVDPAVAAFRVPYRNWQTVYLVAWVDATDPAAVPRGAFRFYRQQAGYAATTAFGIDDPGAIRLPQKTASGQQLYLLPVAVDTAAMNGFRDMHDQFLEFQLTKPLALGRSYPDPIYYGEHPVGPPSSLRIVGIALAESAFDFALTPTQFGHVFEQPDAVTYTLRVTNATSADLPAVVAITATNPQTGQITRVDHRLTVAADGSAGGTLTVPANHPGWYRLQAVVTAGGQTRRMDSSFVLLPPNRRTYGESAAEMRFGSWNLWGHYAAVDARGDGADNTAFLGLMRKLGIRRIGLHTAFLAADELAAEALHPVGPHTTMSVYHRLDVDDPDAMTKMLEVEEKMVADDATPFPRTATYFYGGEWGPSRETTHGVYPIYTGAPIRPLTEEELKKTKRQTTIFTAIGERLRATYPAVQLGLQWGSPMGTIPFMREGFPKELVDLYGMDQPMFEVLPEHLTMGSMHMTLWQLRAESKRLGWPRLPIAWIEGPFLPTNPGALTDQQQADHIVRYFLLGMAYGVEQFQAGVVPFDAGNYYGSEHYGAGVFHRPPLLNPKPAVASIATATQMLCGAELVGPVPTGSLSVYCLAFKQADGTPLHALWRINGTGDATLTVDGNATATITHASGLAEPETPANGTLTLQVGQSPVWLHGAGTIRAIHLGPASYPDEPAAVRRALPLDAATWTWSTADRPSYTNAHIGIPRAPEPTMTATFARPVGRDDQGDSAVTVTLPEQAGNRPWLIRYATLDATAPVPLPGKPSHLGIWVDGNSGFGRIAYVVRDAKGEVWQSTGTVNDWNCDDPHGWSLIAHDGWRYLRFPLPGSHPWDGARELETTWWGSRDGDGIVDYPLSLTAIVVEARNEVPYHDTMTLVPDRDIALAGLTVEYASDAATQPEYLARYDRRLALPDWEGPQTNIIADLRRDGVGEAPVITAFEPPHHFPDGRRMIIRFDQEDGYTYRVYLSLYEDGRGAELLTPRGIDDNGLVRGLKPEVPLYLFLTRIDADKKESPPSPVFPLTTHDNFAEK